MKKSLLFSLIIALLASCSKSRETETNCNLNVAALSGSYRITAVKYKATPTSPEEDYYNQLFWDICERDDIITLNANRTYTFVDAGIKCSYPTDVAGTWSLFDSTLGFDYSSSWSFLGLFTPTYSGSWVKIESFNCSTLTLSNSHVIISGDKIISILTRQ